MKHLFRHGAFFFRLSGVAVLMGLMSLPIVQAKDALIVTSDNIVEIDRNAGTAILKDNVKAVRRSTNSTLLTEYLKIVRDTTSDVVLETLAEGDVELIYRERQAQAIESGETLVNPVFVWCDRAYFDRKSSLGELKGSVRVKSVDFRLDADWVRYHYDTGLGRITPEPDRQVRVIVYKTTADSTADTAGTVFEKQEIVGLADEIRVNRPARKAVLQGNVYIVDKSDQSEFRANRADVFFNEVEEVEEIIANEDFSMNQPGRISKADRAVFEYDKEEVTLIGNAYVKEEDQVEITSERIRMYLKVKKGFIKGVDEVPVRMEIPINE